ncbi:MAG: hypothetical protein L6V93_18235 [Clostridiales bacterium]|nr:MAG: hypothetical protein L6V93_18235 [Clostridiales bacterium]
MKSLQGDKNYRILQRTRRKKITAYESKNHGGKKSSLKSGKTFDVSDCPDITPVFAVICARAEGETVLTGTNRLKKSRNVTANRRLSQRLTSSARNAFRAIIS